MVEYRRAELIAEARRRGFEPPGEGALRVMQNRGLFPPPDRYDETGRGRPGLWSESTLAWVCDLCRLRRLNVPPHPLTLWLLGHAVANPQALLQGELAALGRVVAGEAVPLDRPLDEDQTDRISTSIAKMLRGEIAEQVAYGWPLEAEICRTVEHDVAENDHDLAAHNYLSVNQPVRVPSEMPGWPAASYPSSHTAPNVPTKQRRTIQKWQVLQRLTRCIEGQGAEVSVPALMKAVSAARDNELAQARALALWTMADVLRSSTWQPWNNHLRDKRLDTAAIIEPYGGDIRFLFAAPCLFPLISLLIAQQVRDAAPGDAGLLALALDRLQRRPDRKQEHFDAAVLLLMAWEPAFVPEERKSRGGLVDPWRPKDREQTHHERAREAVEESWMHHPDWSVAETAADLGMPEPLVSEVQRSLRPPPLGWESSEARSPIEDNGVPAPDPTHLAVGERLFVDARPDRMMVGELPAPRWNDQDGRWQSDRGAAGGTREETLTAIRLLAGGIDSAASAALEAMSAEEVEVVWQGVLQAVVDALKGVKGT